MQGLGELEASVMDVLWRTDTPLRVREVLERLITSRPLAYTTVMTVLDNLYRKGWVQRDREGKAYYYRPTWTRDEAAARAMRELLQATGDPDAALLHFARSVSERELLVLRAALDERAGDS